MHLVLALTLAVAMVTSMARSAALAAAKNSPRADTIFGYLIDQKPEAPLDCKDGADDWFFDLDEKYEHLPFLTCTADPKATDFSVTPTEVSLHFHGEVLIGGDASFAPDDTRKIRLQLRQWFGIPVMTDGRFLEQELFDHKDIRYSFSFEDKQDGLFVAEHIERIQEFVAAKPGPSDWDKHLETALSRCTEALLNDAPGDLSWPERPHPWTYPYISWPKNNGQPTTIYMTAFGAKYTDEYGFAQDLPDFGCSYDIDTKAASLTAG